MRDADGVLVPVSDLLRVKAVLIGEGHGAGDVEHVVHWRRALADERLEAVDDAPLEQVEQPVGSGIRDHGTHLPEAEGLSRTARVYSGRCWFGNGF